MQVIEKKKALNINYSKNRGWYDVLDASGVWRLGKCVETKQKIMKIQLDGWSRKNDQSVCEHSQRIAPARTHTRGYTTQIPPLRQQIKDFHIVVSTQTKLKLLLDSSLSSCDINEIITFFRVELFILVDTILTMPLDFQNQKLGFHINMLFLQITNLNIKILLESASNLPTKKLNDKNNDKKLTIHKASYEIFVMMKSIFGLCSRHVKFFKNQQNMFIKSENCVDCFLKCTEGGIKLINTYLKNIMTNELYNQQDFQICKELIMIVLQLFQQRSITIEDVSLKLLVPTIVKYITSAIKDQAIYNKLNFSQYKSMLNKLQNLHLKLKPDKPFALKFDDDRFKKRKGSEYLVGEQKSYQSTILLPTKFKPHKKIESQELFSNGQIDGQSNLISKLEQRLMTLQKKLEQKDLLAQIFKDSKQQKKKAPQIEKKFMLEKKLSMHLERPINSTIASEKKQSPLLRNNIQSSNKINQISNNNPNQIQSPVLTDQFSFVNALQYHISTNDYDTVRKLVNWRKKILQLSTVLGTQMANLIAQNTKDSLQISTRDILSTNLSHLKKIYSL